MKVGRCIQLAAVSGEEKWNSDKLGIQSSMGQSLLPSQSALFIYGRNEKGKTWVRLADLETGELRWENKEFFKKRDLHLFSLSKSKQTIVGNQRPLFDTDDTFMNKKALRKWNAKTGERIWELEIAAVNVGSAMDGVSRAQPYLHPHGHQGDRREALFRRRQEDHRGLGPA